MYRFTITAQNKEDYDLFKKIVQDQADSSGMRKQTVEARIIREVCDNYAAAERVEEHE